MKKEYTAPTVELKELNISDFCVFSVEFGGDGNGAEADSKYYNSFDSWDEDFFED